MGCVEGQRKNTVGVCGLRADRSDVAVRKKRHQGTARLLIQATHHSVFYLTRDRPVTLPSDQAQAHLGALLFRT